MEISSNQEIQRKDKWKKQKEEDHALRAVIQWPGSGRPRFRDISFAVGPEILILSPHVYPTTSPPINRALCRERRHIRELGFRLLFLRLGFC